MDDICRRSVSASSSSSSSSSGLPTPYDLRVIDLDKTVNAFASFPGRMYAGSLPMDHKSDTPGQNPNGERTGFLTILALCAGCYCRKGHHGRMV